jgi:hypothetical protein
MTNKQLIEHAEKTYAEMLLVLAAKSNDYTGGDGAFANFNMASEYGVDPLVGLCVRAGDKVKRIQTYCKTGELKVSHEGIKDAFRDLIGYYTIADAMLEERTYP